MPFGEHVLYGSNMALPKKHDIVFQVMQVGWQGVCVLAYPQGAVAARKQFMKSTGAAGEYHLVLTLRSIMKPQSDTPQFFLVIESVK